MSRFRGRYIDRSHPLMRDLVAWYDFSDGPYSPRLSDKSGNGYHGTLTNMEPATDWVGGPTGGALDFDADNDFISGAYPRVADPSSVTMVTALKSTMPQTCGVCWLSDASTPSGFGWGGFLFTTTTYYWRVAYGSGAASTDVTFAHGSPGGWRCYVGTIRNAAAMTVYMDGVARASGTLGGAARPAYELRVGLRILGGSWAGFLAGQIARVAVFARALSPPEVAELSARLLSGMTDDLYERLSPSVFWMQTPAAGGHPALRRLTSWPTGFGFERSA